MYQKEPMYANFNFIFMFVSSLTLKSELEIEPASKTMQAIVKREAHMTTDLIRKLAEDVCFVFVFQCSLQFCFSRAVAPICQSKDGIDIR
jgi:hypothetical protein